MKLSQPNRKPDVISKLEYLDHKRGDIISTFWNVKATLQDPKYAEHLTGDVLSNVKEIFDYIALDIYESYIKPYEFVTNSIKNIKIYFPFHQNQLVNPKKIFYKLESLFPELHIHLVEFSNKIQTDEFLPGTNVSYSIFNDINLLINSKKHNKLIKILKVESNKIYIDCGTIPFECIIPPGCEITLPTPQKMYATSDYVFELNNKEVIKFCVGAITGIKKISKFFYATYFAP